MKSIAQKIKDKGVTKSHVAEMVGVDLATLSRITTGKQKFVSEDLLNRIHTYLDALNTDDKKLLK